MDDRYFFDKLAQTWDDNEILSTPEKITQIIDTIDIRPGQAVLDLGTGTGVLLPYIAQRVGDKGCIVAVDYSMGMLQKAKEKFQGLIPSPTFLNIDFEKENIDGEFDRIILYCVYPHLHTPIDTLKWLAKVNLRDKGVITIAFPTGPDFINNIHKERHSNSDILPAASILGEILKKNGLNAKVISEGSESYVVNILK